MSEWQANPYKYYRWIVADPELLGGNLAIRGTRLAVSLILECLAVGSLWRILISLSAMLSRTRLYLKF